MSYIRIFQIKPCLKLLNNSKYLFLLLLAIFVSCEKKERGSQPVKTFTMKRSAAPNVPLGNIIGDLTDVEKQDLHILIDKRKMRLDVMYADSTLKSYPVVFGRNPVDDKRMEGDKCTPEGRFNMRDKYDHKKWHKFIWLNYPTDDSWKKHKAAKANGSIPEDAKIGGEIGIHGVPGNRNVLIDTKTNWTLGCIALKNNHLDEVYEIINPETPIEIR